MQPRGANRNEQSGTPSQILSNCAAMISVLLAVQVIPSIPRKAAPGGGDADTLESRWPLSARSIIKYENYRALPVITRPDVRVDLSTGVKVLSHFNQKKEKRKKK